MVEIIDLDRYGVFNWLADIVWGNLTRGGFYFYKKKAISQQYEVPCGILCEFIAGS